MLTSGMSLKQMAEGSSMQLANKIKPPLKWAGSKFNTPVADRVLDLFEPYRDTHLLVEPFVGAGGMLFSINPDRALCANASGEVVGLHQWLRDGGVWFESPAAADLNERYYQRRRRFQQLQSEYAASPDFVDADEFFSLMIWLNKTCHNGLWRVNSQGGVNVPVGKNSANIPHQPKAPDLDMLRQAYKSDWVFVHSDFGLLSDYRLFEESERFVYCDPPYWGTHSAYTADVFNWTDQLYLARWAESLACPVVISNSDHPDLLELYWTLGFNH